MPNVRAELTLKFKNPILDDLLEPIRQQPGGLYAWAKTIGLIYQDVWSFLRLRKSPYTRRGDWSKRALIVSEALNVAPEILFPGELYRNRYEEKKAVHDIDAQALLSLQQIKKTVLFDSPETALVIADGIEQAMSSLSERHRKILTLRFGLDGQGERTLVEIAEEFGLSRGRVQQIEAKALSKMQHRSRRKYLPERQIQKEENESC